MAVPIPQVTLRGSVVASQGTGDAWMLQTKIRSICKGREDDYNNCFAPVACCWLYIKRKKKRNIIYLSLESLPAKFWGNYLFLHLLFAWLYKYNTCLRKEQQCSFQPCRISIHSKFIWHLSWLAVNLSQAREKGGERAGEKQISTKQKMFVSLSLGAALNQPSLSSTKIRSSTWILQQAAGGEHGI